MTKWELEGPTEEAASYYREAIELRREMGERTLQSHNLAGLASVLLWRDGDLAKTRPILDQAMVLADEQNIPFLRGYVLTELANYRLLEGSYEEALRLAKKALELVVSDDEAYVLAGFYHGIALLALGYADQATVFLKPGLSWMVKKGALGHAGVILPFIAILLDERGDDEKAAELLGYGSTHSHTSGHRPACRRNVEKVPGMGARHLPEEGRLFCFPLARMARKVQVGKGVQEAAPR